MIRLVLIGPVGGLITGVSPFVLPVLPVVFPAERSGYEIRHLRLPGMARRVVGTRRSTNPRRPFLIVAGLTLSPGSTVDLGVRAP